MSGVKYAWRFSKNDVSMGLRIIFSPLLAVGEMAAWVIETQPTGTHSVCYLPCSVHNQSILPALRILSSEHEQFRYKRGKRERLSPPCRDAPYARAVNEDVTRRTRGSSVAKSNFSPIVLVCRASS